MKKHAYLIIAHNNIPMLCKLLSLIDDERNDVYLHYDKKSVLTEDDIQQIESTLKKSKFTMVDRMGVAWGGYSLVQCELNLIKASIEGNYEYYHFLSGIDFPLKSQNEIHDFFERHRGEEYIEFWDRPKREYLYRVKYYYPLQEHIGTYTYDIKTLLLRVRSKLGVLAQRLRGVNRLKEYAGEFKIGSNWLSITHEFAQYLLDNEELIYRLFHDGIAVDEMFIHTLCYNSDFRKKVSNDRIRLIDWKRGNPYVWKMEDYEEICASTALFIRKVADNGLPEKLEKHIREKD